MVKISDKEYIISETDIIDNYNKLIDDQEYDNVVFGLSHYDSDRIIPEYVIFTISHINTNLYKFNDIYRITNKVNKLDPVLTSKLINKYFGIPIKYHLIIKEDHDGS